MAPDARRTGIARALVATVEAWGAASGCRELASDAALNNGASHSLHAALGFEETERVVFFRKPIVG
ncbi:MAG TPA: GNAT family N-acetyltransferase [Caulobacteraceae bacterium]